MPGSGKSSKAVEIDGQKFLIDKGIELPPIARGPKDLTKIKEQSDRTGCKSDKFSSHEIGGTFDLYCEVRLKQRNYARNGIYYIIEA